MVDRELLKYAYMWTIERNNFALFTVECYGKKEFLIYHIPTRTIRMITDNDLGKKLIDKLLEKGIPLLQDAPDGIKHHTASPIELAEQNY